MATVGLAGGLNRVQDILSTRPEYLNCLPADYDRRVIFPAIVTKKLRFLCDYLAFVTWFSPSYPPDGVPDGREFIEKGPITWIVDVVAMPGVEVMRLGREVSETLHLHGGVKDGGRVLFWRWPKGRVGYITARKPRRIA